MERMQSGQMFSITPHARPNTALHHFQIVVAMDMPKEFLRQPQGLRIFIVFECIGCPLNDFCKVTQQPDG